MLHVASTLGQLQRWSQVLWPRGDNECCFISQQLGRMDGWMFNSCLCAGAENSWASLVWAHTVGPECKFFRQGFLDWISFYIFAMIRKDLWQYCRGDKAWLLTSRFYTQKACKIWSSLNLIFHTLSRECYRQCILWNRLLTYISSLELAHGYFHFSLPLGSIYLVSWHLLSRFT